MTDYISRQDITNRLEIVIKHGAASEDGEHPISAEVVLETVKRLPSAPVREVVTCGECRFRDPEDKKCENGAQWCAFPKNDDDFCSYAERKE